MFVLSSTHDKVRLENLSLQMRLALLKLQVAESEVRYRKLRNRVASGEFGQGSFTPDEIKTLVRLCHPDKHNGSKAANEITQKLLAMR